MSNGIPPWSKVPFIRLLLPLCGGIMLQWHLALDAALIFCTGLCSALLLALHFFLPFRFKFQYRVFTGINIHLLLVAAGAWLAWKNLPGLSLGNQVNEQPSRIYQCIVLEPAIEKPNTFKLKASLRDVRKPPGEEEKIIIYLQKSPKASLIKYGSSIIFQKTIERVKNSGNPGSFDYRTYCLFNGIGYQCYLRDDEYIISEKNESTIFKNFIFSCNEWTIGVIKRFIPSAKEQGLAEALLIGYKNDLDKDLVQAYSNTGVVHVIAISGLHLGLIYGILLFLTRPLKKKKQLAWARLVLVLSGLWIFSIMAGAQPSVLRSAIMFTCLALGEVLDRKTSIYNSLAFSAFLVLCYNPFWLWDAGFQLSYSAVISIISFYKPLYNCLWFKNKFIDLVWQLSAVTLSAQLLTLPVSIYHFHQFPLLFYFTNMLAVPVSSLILIGEIILCAISFIPLLAYTLGNALTWLIKFMNQYVERFNDVSFAVIDHLSISFLQSFLLALSILCFCFWLMTKARFQLWSSLLFTLAFVTLRCLSFYEEGKKSVLLVYNIPKWRAIEIITGHSCFFMGDREVLTNKTIYNFNLYPSHVKSRILTRNGVLPLQSFILKNYRITICDGQVQAGKNDKKNLLVITGKKTLEINSLVSILKPIVVIIDGSVPQWKAKKLRTELELLHTNYHDVSEKGAFLMKL